MDRAKTNDRRTRLKTATAALHARVERHLILGRVFSTHGGYNAYLRQTLLAREAVEIALEASGVGEIYCAWPYRRLAPLLREDLRDLAPECDPPQQPNTTGTRLTSGEILGALYVLEGSTLGGRIIAEHLASLGFSASFGARHVATARRDPLQFQAFIDLLNNTPLDDAEEPRCEQSAIATFLRFEGCYLGQA